MSVENFAKMAAKKSLGAPELPLDPWSVYAAEVQAKVALGDGARKPSWSTGSWNTLGFSGARAFLLLARFGMASYRS
jgi:hypothetical protein